MWATTISWAGPWMNGESDSWEAWVYSFFICSWLCLWSQLLQFLPPQLPLNGRGWHGSMSQCFIRYFIRSTRMELRQLLCACFSHLRPRLWFVLSHTINLTKKQQAVTMPQSECYAILKFSPSNKFPCYFLIDLHSNSQNMGRNSQIFQDTIRRTSSPIPVESLSPTKLQDGGLIAGTSNIVLVFCIPIRMAY